MCIHQMEVEISDCELLGWSHMQALDAPSLKEGSVKYQIADRMSPFTNQYGSLKGYHRMTVIDIASGLHVLIFIASFSGCSCPNSRYCSMFK